MESKKPNIIFIMADAVRARNLGCYGYHRNTSPNIDSLAKKGVLFENVFSSNNVSNKQFLSILGGKRVIAEGPLINYVSKKEIQGFFETGGVLFPEMLKKQGYKTYFLKDIYGWQKKGFDYYFKCASKEDKSNVKWRLINFSKKFPIFYKTLKYSFHNLVSKKLANKIRERKESEKVTREAIEIIKKSKKNPFFMWLYYGDTHLPYNVPSKFNNKFIANKKSKNLFKEISNKGMDKRIVDFLKVSFSRGDTIEDAIAQYDCAIAYVDSLVKRVVNALEKKNILENTIIFIFADHGESHAEHNIYFNHYGPYGTVYQVPLIIFGKGIPKNKRIKSFIQHEDLAPTIFNILNINHSPTLFDGGSLIPLMNGEKEKIRDHAFMVENSSIRKKIIRTKKYSYMESASKEDATCKVCNKIHQGVIELYDLENDPGENINIAKKNKKALIEMKLKLNKTIKDLKNLNEKRRINQVLSKI